MSLLAVAVVDDNVVLSARVVEWLYYPETRGVSKQTLG